MTTESELRDRIENGHLAVVTTRACAPEEIPADERVPGSLYVMHDTGRCWIEGGTPAESFDLFTLCGYDRIRDAYAAQLGAAPIQIRSTVPFVLSGIICQFIPLSPSEIVAQMAAGTPFLLDRHQAVSAIVATIRHVGGLNARCAENALPEAARQRMRDVLTLRLAAERATDRGLMLSRLDNAILSALASSRDQTDLSIPEIIEWIGQRIDEQHSTHAILGALGTLGWRGFTILRNAGATPYYRLTPSGCAALLSEIGKLAALHRDVPGARGENITVNRAA